MLDDLVGVIETLKARIQNHGPDLQANEIRTRMALIDPLLQALGWDTADPSLVTPEYNVSGRWADYALLSGSKPAAIIEAKKLDESLESHRMQMLNYSNASGIQYAGLTDGNRWELYEIFKQAPLEERRILDVSIASNPAHQAALQLLLLWRPNLASGQPDPASEPILSAPMRPYRPLRYRSPLSNQLRSLRPTPPPLWLGRNGCHCQNSLVPVSVPKPRRTSGSRRAPNTRTNSGWTFLRIRSNVYATEAY